MIKSDNAEKELLKAVADDESKGVNKADVLFYVVLAAVIESLFKLFPAVP
jgi:hypothetical protein